MNGFLVAAAVTVLVVLVVLMRPFFRRIAPGATSRKDLNSAIYREQFAKLEQDLAEGMIAKDDYAQARAELQRRLLEEVQVEEAAVTVNPPRKTMIGIALAVPLVAGAFYLLIGNPGSLSATAGRQMA
ncbi:MAG TPA: c-type cytochrome biogenesis protein CcmI, partial [Ramlibacter sp.]|nr:c-type cytochrome biogenesis protein CcmI [Ramlibacter sp.]